MLESVNTAAETHLVVINACVHKVTELLRMEGVAKVRKCSYYS